MPRSTLLGVLTAAALAACGARTGLLVPDVNAVDAREASVCVAVDDACGATEICGNGADDNCDGAVDEGCACTQGAVQRCFAGPPGRRNVGVCADGQQACRSDGRWGPCEGGIRPHEEASCNGADNLCTGCSRDVDCPIACPGPGDVRVHDGAPFQPYALRGGDFFAGAAAQWRWSVEGGPCDTIALNPSFHLENYTRQDATFLPVLSGDYTVTLEVRTASGETLRCSFVIHVLGPGVRVEMCYPESATRDLDLYVHRPGNQGPWFEEGTGNAYWASGDACSWRNCEAHLRSYILGAPQQRADWGYGPSPLAECEHGPYGYEWRQLGYCANPRLDLDNNLQEGIGVPENVNIDAPRDGESYRVMVQNFTGSLAHPLINVYCGGSRVATLGAPGDTVEHFLGTPGSQSFGAMWRAADVTAHVDASGTTTGCTVTPIHPASDPRGYAVTHEDPSF